MQPLLVNLMRYEYMLSTLRVAATWYYIAPSDEFVH